MDGYILICVQVLRSLVLKETENGDKVRKIEGQKDRSSFKRN
jgi:hypothetical protein